MRITKRWATRQKKLSPARPHNAPLTKNYAVGGSAAENRRLRQCLGPHKLRCPSVRVGVMLRASRVGRGMLAGLGLARQPQDPVNVPGGGTSGGVSAGGARPRASSRSCSSSRCGESFCRLEARRPPSSHRYSRVLEVRLGPGFFSIEVARARALSSADIQLEMLQMARRRLRRAGVRNASYTQANAVTWPFRAGAFNRASLVAVLGDVPSQGVLSSIADALRPEACFQSPSFR